MSSYRNALQRAADQPRRSLIETGVKLRSITHELGLRGVERGECRHCWGAPPTE